MQMTISLREEVADFLIQRGAENNMTPEAYSALALTNLFLASSDDAPDQVAAERAYWELIHKILQRIIRERIWGPDITKKVFEEIEQHHRTLYERAIGADAYGPGNPTKYRINIETASRIKTALKAEVRVTPAGRPTRGAVTKGLITSFSKLYPTESKEGGEEQEGHG